MRLFSSIHFRRIVTNTARIGLLTAGVKVAGAAKTVLSARYFGAGDDLDAYLIAFLLPSFLGDVLAAAILQSTMPHFLNRPEREDKLYPAVLYSSFQALAGLALFVALASAPILRVLASGFGPAKLELTQKLLFVLLPLLPLSALNNTWRTVLNAHERFLMAAMAPILLPLATICALVAFGGTWGILTLAIATTVGALLESATLALAVWQAGYAPFPRTKASWMELRPLLGQYFPLVLANLLMGGSLLVDQSFAASFGAGSISALNLGTRVVAVILAVGPASLGTALFPQLSRLAASADWAGWRRHLKSYVWIGFLCALPVSGLLCLFSTPIVRQLFERGAFTAADTQLVASVQTFAFLQIPFAVVLAMLVKAVSSRRANHLLMRFAVFNLLAAITFDLFLSRWLGIAGIALAATAVQATGIAVLLSMLSKDPKSTAVEVLN